MRIILLIILLFGLVDIVNARFVPKSFEGIFHEVTAHSKIKVKVKYLYPGHIYYQTFDEDEPMTLYVCNSEKTYKYNYPWDKDEKGELLLGDSNKFCYSKVFDALAKGIGENNYYQSEINTNKAIIHFKENTRKQLGLKKIEIDFKKDHKVSINSSLTHATNMILFFDTKPEPVKIELTSINDSNSLKINDFHFQAPKNTNIKQMK